uniref:Uncharacterized protein n=1 Tax=Gadus morhua TaxID=8049 RepID=A0A8C5A5M1_GADMO
VSKLVKVFYKMAYITPSRLKKMDNSLSHLCWHGCGEAGTLMHQLWQCPAVQCFWKCVIFNLSSFLNVRIPLCPLTCHLGSRVENIESTVTQRIIYTEGLAVKLHLNVGSLPTLRGIPADEGHVSIQIICCVFL